MTKSVEIRDRGLKLLKVMSVQVLLVTLFSRYVTFWYYTLNVGC